MKIIHTIGALAVLSAIIVVLMPFPVSAAAMSDYCQSPPLKAGVSPNIMLTIDVSGSMGWAAYSYKHDDTNGDGYPDSGYDPNTIYEGYFDPSKSYKKDGSGIYSETTSTTNPCKPGVCKTWTCYKNDQGGCKKDDSICSDKSKPWACCTAWSTVQSGDCGWETGNFLNYALMHRVDLFRWAMTGGKPASCGSGAQQGLTGNDCDPEVWANVGNDQKVGKVCNNSLDVDNDGVADGGCILEMDNTDKVKVRWDRVYAGLAFQFANMTLKPRMGAMFYEGDGVRSNKVYLGDFTGANSKTVYEFFNMITEINGQDPGDTTPTGPALWDTLNYFAMNPPKYGGFPEQSGSGDRWKNPMYTCQNGGTNCVYVPCADNFVILMSDGEWNRGGDPGAVKDTCSIDEGTTNSADPVVPAYLMHRGFTNAATNVASSVRGLYSISLFMDSVNGVRAMQNVALYGSFDKTSKTWPDGRTDYPKSTCGSSCKGSLCTALPPSSVDWDSDGDGDPDTYFSGKTAITIKSSIMAAVQEILSHTTAGTAASVLASREGSGANLLQAVYYPKKTFTNATVDWVGNLQNLWYYIDPAFANSTIREDGDSDGVLTLKTDGTHKDYITQFYYDAGLQAAMAKRWTDDNGDASITGETPMTAIKVDTVANIWEAGELLWARDWKARRVYTSIVSGTSSTNLIEFKCTAAGTCPNKSILKPYLDAATDDQASTIMEWVLGNDLATSATYTGPFRKREATLITASTTTTHVWKLGDVINSTPKISSWQPLGDYHLTYNKYETTYGPQGSGVYQSDPVNTAYYTTGYQYKGRGMVYTGGNDGMLHAFRLGLLQTKWSGQGTYEKAKLTKSVCSSTKSIFCSSNSQCPSTETCTGQVTLGEEVWAFIPKNVLPYLKYIADPDYCHVYTVDLTPTIFDASINVPTGCTEPNYYDCKKVDATSWRTVLIGGMRLGGGCRKPGFCTPGISCISTPAWDPVVTDKGLGYSSYFALDITDQDNPKLMWEYDGTLTHSDNHRNMLGLSYSGPAVVRISNTKSGSLSVTQAAQNNGKWLVVFGSGPTGPIDTVNQQFIGLSDRNLTLHVFDLATGPGSDNDKVKVIDTAIPNSFSGSITTTTFDIDLDYSDDVIYIPYTSASTSAPDSSSGGLLRLVTKSDINPANWEWSNVITNTGPITAAPDMLIDPTTNDLWLYFGAGRYFYDTVTSLDDADPTKRRQIFGIKERCLDKTTKTFLSKTDCNNVAAVFCATPAGSVTCGGLTNVDSISVANNLEATKASSTDPNYKGWYIDLDPAITATTPNYYGERMITNPSVDATGIVFFTTFKPQNNACQKDGQTNIWAVKFDTGGAATGLIQGTAIIQVSTGSIEQINLATAFTERDNRRTAGMTGQPPTREGLTVIPGAPAVSKPLFMKER